MESLKKQVGGISLGILLWLVISGVLAYLGFFNDFTTLPPKFIIVILVPLITILWGTSTDSFRQMVRHISPQQILYLQGFRVVVEILLWMLFIAGSIPEQMTFEGLNWDILAGITGPVAGFLFYKNKIGPFAVKVWNICGLVLLINIIIVAILSTPVPFRLFMNEPANTIVTTFPIVWLPAFLVPLAYGLHIISWIQMSQLEKDRGKSVFNVSGLP
jgi:hypothetical protein